MTESSSSFFSCKLCFNPLSDQKNIYAFTILSNVIKTCIGPSGKLKLIRNSSSSHTTITSSSPRLFHLISIKNSLSKYIISSAKSYLNKNKDGGLRLTYFILSLIKHSSLSDISRLQLATLFEYFTKTFIECLNSEDNLCSWRINFSNVKQLQLIIKTLLSSKPGCLLTQNQKDHLCNILLEAFLKIFPSTSKILDNFNIRFLTINGNDVLQSKLFDGILIKVPRIDWGMLSRSSFISAKVALFTISLSGDVDLPEKKFRVSYTFSLSEAVLKHLRIIIQKLISENVDVVFCQKVVHPSLRKQLTDVGVAVFDQLGSETAGYLQYILGGNANSSLFGNLTFRNISCSKEEIGKDCYLLLKTDSYPFCTLLLYNYNEEACLELKVVCQQVITTLFQLLINSKICFGAGCTEIYTIISLIKKISSKLDEMSTTLGCNSSRILSALDVYMNSLIDVAISSHQTSRIDFVFDKTHGHLWKTRDGNHPTLRDTCACGCFTASDITISDWYYLSDLQNIFSSFSELGTQKNFSFLVNEKLESKELEFFSEKISVNSKELDLFSKPLLLDVLSCKMNFIAQASEIATMFLKSEYCVFCGVSDKETPKKSLPKETVF